MNSRIDPIEAGAHSVGRQGRALLAFAEAIIPGSKMTRGADERTSQDVTQLIGSLSPLTAKAFSSAVVFLDQAARFQTGSAFHALTRERQAQLLASWQQNAVLRGPLHALSLLIKTAHFDRQAHVEPVGPRGVGASEASSGITTAEEWAEGADIECDVVVIGTGAGGAVVGRELADRGLAVVFVEQGRKQRPEEFQRGLANAHMTYTRTVFALGTAPFPVLMGRLVGGSTAINGGTCFRTPSAILTEWSSDLDTDDLTPSRMAERFERIEARLMVSEPERRFIGPIAGVIDRGAKKLGWHAGPIQRNASGCEGEGFCGLGCASGARRSVEVSVLPGAIARGAVVLSSARATGFILEAGRCVGVEVEGDRGRRLRVRGKAVVLAGGAISSPMLLLRQGLANSSGQLGRNLSVHPSMGVGGYFDECINPGRHIPQGYMVDEFVRDGILLLAAQPNESVAHALFPATGQRFMRAIDSLPHLAMLGVMIRDQSRGRVWSDVKGKPLVTYNVGARDLDLMKQALVYAGRLCWAAGARRVHLGLVGAGPCENEEQFRSFTQRRLRAAELALISYHPLGTCKMGRDPRSSVVDLDHESHDVPGLFVVDGSTVPSPPGVNPQLTIMALALRAAERIAMRLS